MYDTKLALGFALARQERYSEAEHLYQALARIPQTVAMQRAQRDSDYGALLIATGHLHESVPELQRAIAVFKRHGAVELELNALSFLATAQLRLGNSDDALSASREVLELTAEYFPNNEIRRGMAEAKLGSRLREFDPVQAEPYLRKALQRFRRVLGDDHQNTIHTGNNFALLLWNMQRYSEAEALLRSNIEHRTRLYGDGSREVGEAWQNLAALLFELGEYPESITAARKAQSSLDKALPADHYLRAFPMLTIAGAQIASDQPQAARRTLGEAHVLLEPALPADSLPRKVVRARGAMALAALGECQQALPLLVKARDELDGTHRVLYASEFDRAFAHCPRAEQP